MTSIEGKHAVVEALRAGVPIERVLISSAARQDRSVTQIEQLAVAAGVALVRVRKAELDAISERGAHQGVIAEVRAFRYTPLAEVIESVEGRESALVIVLDHVTDPGNLGAVARSADAAGAAALVVASRRAAAITPAAYKAAAGALSWIPVVQEPNIVRAIERLKEAGFWVAGADERGEQTAWDAPLDGRIVLVLGAEGAGLSRLVREHCDMLVRLPMAGHVSSLNVAQAGTLLAFEWMRRTSR